MSAACGEACVPALLRLCVFALLRCSVCREAQSVHVVSCLRAVGGEAHFLAFGIMASTGVAERLSAGRHTSWHCCTATFVNPSFPALCILLLLLMYSENCVYTGIEDSCSPPAKTNSS